MKPLSMRWEPRKYQTHYIDMFIDEKLVASYNSKTDQFVIKHASKSILVHHQIKEFIREVRKNDSKR